MSGSKVFLLRHAESQHNIDKNFERLDPALTESGTKAAEQLGSSFPEPDSVGVILSSPSQRAIQTAFAIFPSVLDRRYFAPASGNGVEAGAVFIVDPDAQERSALPCDTCSTRESLQQMFPYLDFSHLSDAEGAAWRSKTGTYSEHDEAVKTRATRLREMLEKLMASYKGSSRPNVALVTHGVFMKALTNDSSIDLPRPGWAAYHIQKGDDGNVVLVAAD
ncbi:hypothetical protein B0A52_09602 [Exophiala mesophila]|uniref:Phosphoglycerate mutase-like protein n=1 Tax=Exophiala mesophila TaxID=212818 RepID=A0A438MT61_EXOME|nr:hypothetical protein B0A52_09602 [Exophiala mesophila]